MADQIADQSYGEPDAKTGVLQPDLATAAEKASDEAEAANIEHAGAVLHSAPEGYATGNGEEFKVTGDEDPHIQQDARTLAGEHPAFPPNGFAEFEQPLVSGGTIEDVTPDKTEADTPLKSDPEPQTGEEIH